MSSPDDRTADSPTPPPSETSSTAPPTPPEDSLVITLPDESSAPKDLALWAGVLVILTLVVYWPATEGSFLWGDDRRVSDNNLLAQPGGLGTIWFKRWQDDKQYPLPEYHPTAYTSYWLDYRLFGHDAETHLPTPFMFRLSNLLLHALTAVLVWLVLRRLKLPGAWVAAAVFALHPLNTEAVAWISQRATVLAGALFFGAIYCYLLFAEEEERAHAGEHVDPVREWGFYAASFVLFVLAMLSKSAAFAMPLVMMLLLWWRRKLSGRQVILLAPFVIIGAAMAFAALDFERDTAATAGAGWDGSITERLAIAGHAIWFYVAKLLAPMRLTFMYPKWSIDAGNAMLFLPLAAATVLLLWMLIAQRRFGRGPLVAMLAAVLCLLPALGIVNIAPMQFTFVADHYAYLATVPLIALIIAAAAKALRRARGQSSLHAGTAVGLSAILLLTLGAMTWARAHVFTSELNLWADTVEKNPDSWFARNRYATALGLQAASDQAFGDAESYAKNLEAALAQAQAAAELNPKDGEAQWIIGRVLMQQPQLQVDLPANMGATTAPTKTVTTMPTARLDAAVEHLRQATQLDPKLADAWQDLATTLLKQKKYQEAIDACDAALRVQSQSSATHRLLAEAYSGLNDFERAIGENRTAIRLKPDNILARENLADLLAMKNTAAYDKEAKLQYTTVLQVQRNRPEVWNKLGILYARGGDMGTAITMFEAALQLLPDFKEAADNRKMAIGALEKQRQSAATRAATRATTAPSRRRIDDQSS